MLRSALATLYLHSTSPTSSLQDGPGTLHHHLKGGDEILGSGGTVGTGSMIVAVVKLVTPSA